MTNNFTVYNDVVECIQQVEAKKETYKKQYSLKF